jgi:hypothetical protein
MNPRTHKKTALRVLIPGLSALTLVALSMTGCDSGSSSNGGYNAQPLRDSGAVVYAENCAGCHGDRGEGAHGPILANSDFLMNNRQLSIHLVLRGNQVEPMTVPSLTVRGRQITGGGMPGWHDILTDYQIASVLSYLHGVLNDSLVISCTSDEVCTTTPRTAADMAKDYVLPSEVKAVRDSLGLSNP